MSVQGVSKKELDAFRMGVLKRIHHYDPEDALEALESVYSEEEIEEMMKPSEWESVYSRDGEYLGDIPASPY